MKFLKRFLVMVAVAFFGAVLSFFGWVYLKHVTPILMYHHVELSDHDEADKVNPEVFDRQMSAIKEFGYKTLSMEEYMALRLAGKKVPRKDIVITFDDGYEDNYTQAFPILKKYGHTATIFLHVEKIGTPGYLTWEEIKEMQQHGIFFGSHSLTHPHLPSFSEKEQRWELSESKRILEEKLGHSIEFVAYPAGAFNEATKRAAKDAGYKAGLTTNRGYVLDNSDFFELKRVRLSNSDVNKLYIWVKIAGYSNVFRKGEKPS